MLTSMVARPGPGYYNNETNGRQPHQALEAVPPQLSPSSTPPASSSNNLVVGAATQPATSVVAAAATTSDTVSDTCSTSSTPISTVINGTMVSEMQDYTPPHQHIASIPQGPPPPYCTDYYPGEYYPGPPPDYNCPSHHTICAINGVTTINGGVSGPATVRMVSTNATPPIPLPVQMPPGHVVQQIVDETGTLQHVIVSAQPVPLSVCYGPNANQSHQFYTHGPPPGPQSYMAYSPAPPYPPVMSPPITQHSPPPLNYPKPERNPRQYDKTRNKFYNQRHPNIPSQHQCPPQQNQQQKNNSSSTSIHTSTPLLSPKKGDIHCKKIVSNEESVNGDDAQEIHNCLLTALSQVKSPEVSAITPFTAHLQWKCPDFSNPIIQGISPSDVKYEVFLNNSLHTSVNSTEVSLTNLRAGTEYKLYLVCICNSVRGSRTPPKTFTTKATEPDAPNAPRLVERSKNSLLFRWNATKDNGARISNYILEVIGGQFPNWTEIHCHRNKQGTLSKLKPQTTYRVRLSATNEIGKSNYSPEVVESTSGLAPSPPQPPSLEKATVDSLSLVWVRRPSDETFTLQIEDSVNGYGFMNAFIGREVSFTCNSLRRNSDYKFRLCSQNPNGMSPFSGIASYRTLPDRPSHPSLPVLKGKAHSDKISVTWSPPKDNGGIPLSGYHVEIDKGQGFEKVYSGNQSECEIRGLVPGKTYRVRCCAESAGGVSEWSEEGSVSTKPVAPGPCLTPKTVGRPKANTIQLKWVYPESDGGSPIIEFQLEMVDSGSERKQVYCGRDLECTVASLLPGRPYTFFLRAVNRVGPGPWSDSYEVCSGAGPPDAVNAPLLSCTNPHIVFLHWNEPPNNGANIDQYIVQMAKFVSNIDQSHNSSNDLENDLSFSCAYTGSNLSCEIANLVPASIYGFRVTALNSAGQSVWSPLSKIETPPAAPGPVGNITSETEATELTIRWNEPLNHGDSILYYNIEVADRSFSTNGPVLEFTVTDLLPETSYRVRIKAVNSVGAGSFGSTHRVTTGPLPPSAPHIELVKASYNSLRLRWGDGRNPDLLKYSLQMEFLNARKSMEFYQIYSGTNQSFKVTKLDENTTYKFRICASNEAGIGPYSAVVEFSTIKAPPLPLKPPKVTEGPEGTYCLEWNGCKSLGEDKILYRLQILQAGKDIDYSLVYTGSETSHVLTGLEPQSGYYVRVCGVRICSDGDIMAGAYSSPTMFNTPKLPEVEVDKVIECQTQERHLSWHTLSDHEKSAAFLALFTLFSFIAAYILSPDASVR